MLISSALANIRLSSSLNQSRKENNSRSDMCKFFIIIVTSVSNRPFFSGQNLIPCQKMKDEQNRWNKYLECAQKINENYNPGVPTIEMTVLKCHLHLFLDLICDLAVKFPGTSNKNLHVSHWNVRIMLKIVTARLPEINS